MPRPRPGPGSRGASSRPPRARRRRAAGRRERRRRAPSSRRTRRRSRRRKQERTHDAAAATPAAAAEVRPKTASATARGGDRPGKRAGETPAPCRRRGATGSEAERSCRMPSSWRRDVARRLPSLLRLLRETDRDDAIERSRGERMLARDRGGIVPEDRADERRARRARKRRPSGDHLVEHAARGRRCRSARRRPCPRAAPAPCTGRFRGPSRLRSAASRSGSR